MLGYLGQEIELAALGKELELTEADEARGDPRAHGARLAAYALGARVSVPVPPDDLQRQVRVQVQVQVQEWARCRVGASPVVTRQSERVVGMPSAAIASWPRNSRTLERSTARPSERRLYGVRPAPLSCTSFPSTCPMEIARPSPRCPPYRPAKLAP